MKIQQDLITPKLGFNSVCIIMINTNDFFVKSYFFQQFHFTTFVSYGKTQQVFCLAIFFPKTKQGQIKVFRSLCLKRLFEVLKFLLTLIQNVLDRHFQVFKFSCHHVGIWICFRIKVVINDVTLCAFYTEDDKDNQVEINLFLVCTLGYSRICKYVINQRPTYNFEQINTLGTLGKSYIFILKLHNLLCLMKFYLLCSQLRHCCFNVLCQKFRVTLSRGQKKDQTTKC